MKIAGKHKDYPVSIKETNPRERNYQKAWTATTGNVVTTSKVSEIRCMELHIAKLDKELEQINRNEREVERNSSCY